MLTTLKKAQNSLDNPVYPDIRKAPPRFVDSGKHWTVDVGRTMGQTEFIPQFQEPAVLAQSRTYNKDIYGKSSHKDVVNKALRPPLLTQEDYLPLNRIPRSETVPILNPSTVGGGFKLYPRETELLTEFTVVDKEHYTTERVKHGYGPPRYYRPLDIKENIGGVVPDLKVKVARAPMSITTSTSIKNMAPGISSWNHGLEAKTRQAQSAVPLIESYANIPNKISPFEVPYIELEEKIPYTSIAALPSKRIDDAVFVRNIDLADKSLHTSRFVNPSVRLDRIDPIDHCLDAKISVKNLNAGASAKIDLIDRSTWSSPKLQNPIQAPMRSEKSYHWKSLNNHKKPQAKDKPSLVPTNYQTRGFVPRSGIDTVQVSLKKVNMAK